MTTTKCKTRRTKISGQCPAFNCPGDLHERMNGATISAPKQSPIHHVSQSDQKVVQSAAPPRQRLKLPIVALTIGANTAAHPTNPITSATESSELRQRATRCSNRTAATASRVFPVAMPSAEATGMSVKKFAASAPRKTPGQTRMPNIKSADIAMPVGGQTGVTLL